MAKKLNLTDKYEEQIKEATAPIVEEPKRGRGRPKGPVKFKINLSFEGEIAEYINTMAKLEGVSKSEFVTRAISYHKAQHKGIYDQVIQLRESIGT